MNIKMNDLDCLSVFIDRNPPVMVCSPVSALFNDTVIGYVLLLRKGVPMLITANPHPYIIPADIADKYFLSTGDKISATVSTDGAGKHIVTGIVRVNRQEKVPLNYTPHFNNMPAGPSAGSVTINGQKVSLGSTVMISIKQNEFTNEKVAEIINGCHAPNAQKISLGVQEKPENLTYLLSHGSDYGYNIMVRQPLKQQLMVMLTAFLRAEELVERGHNVFLFISSFEKLLFLFNNAIMESNLCPAPRAAQNAERDLARIMKQSKTLSNGGSLTLLGFQLKDGSTDNQAALRRISLMCDFVI